MLKDECEELYADLETALKAVEFQARTPMERLTGSVSLVRERLTRLRDLVTAGGFAGEDEEIDFFKRVKPKFYAHIILHAEQFNVVHRQPAGIPAQLKKYFRQEIEVIRHYFKQHGLLYEYFRSGMTEMDALYFTRRNARQDWSIPEMPGADPLFSTSGDYLFSKFIALEKQQDWLLRKIEELEPAVFGDGVKKARQLRWTGESINLVELGYGLFDSGQFNDGKAGIGEIFSWLEENLQISIGIPARRFVEITRRKRLSRTKFLDQLRDAVNRKADEGDAFVPGKGNRKFG
jgi:hypothetical protein